ncbi:p24 [Mint virus 2]|uniref:p24 n=1 Tax=Mint virus 2 TaxID=312998 RepID=Q52V14_9VIRU|nr:p24 [Mint virus 2]AAX07260.1 p24 [Mint virus 2]
MSRDYFKEFIGTGPGKSKSEEVGVEGKPTTELGEVCRVLVENGVGLGHFKSNPVAINKSKQLRRLGVLVLELNGYNESTFLNRLEERRREISRTPSECSVGEEKGVRERKISLVNLCKEICTTGVKGEPELELQGDQLRILLSWNRTEYSWDNNEFRPLGFRTYAFEQDRLRQYKWSLHGLNAFPNAHGRITEISGSGLRDRQRSGGCL